MLFAVEKITAPADFLITAFDSESRLDRAVTEQQQAASTGIERAQLVSRLVYDDGRVGGWTHAVVPRRQPVA